MLERSSTAETYSNRSELHRSKDWVRSRGAGDRWHTDRCPCTQALGTLPCIMADRAVIRLGDTGYWQLTAFLETDVQALGIPGHLEGLLKDSPRKSWSLWGALPLVSKLDALWLGSSFHFLTLK